MSTTSNVPSGRFRTRRFRITVAVTAAAIIAATAGTVIIWHSTSTHDTAVAAYRTARSDISSARTALTDQRDTTRTDAAAALKLAASGGDVFTHAQTQALKAAGTAANTTATHTVIPAGVSEPLPAAAARGTLTTATAVLRKQTTTTHAATTMLERADERIHTVAEQIAAATTKITAATLHDNPSAAQSHLAALRAITTTLAGPATPTASAIATVSTTSTSSGKLLQQLAEYVHDVQTVRVSNTAERGKAAAKAAAAQATGTAPAAGSTSGQGTTPAGSSQRSDSWSATGPGSSSSASRSAGTSAPSRSGSAPAPAAPAPAPARPAPAPAPAPVIPPKYALQHATHVSSCNPGEFTISFGPNVNSVPPLYITVSSSWNGSDWVYSGTTCG